MLESYGEKTKIDVQGKTVDGMHGIKFPDYKQMLHAANIINFCKVAYRGKCKSNTPFTITDL